MRKRILLNDIKGNRLLSVTTWLFMVVSAFMLALTCFLFVNLMGSVDTLMAKARTPDFLQMHAGELSEPELMSFVEENEAVAEYQTLLFLNLENSSVELDGHSLADSTQDNGVCVQSDSFDYLLDQDNEVIQASEGEIWVPVCYKREYDLDKGEAVRIGQKTFTIAGFLRDSQMSSMMSSSKRFLISQTDYDRLRESGSEEYLIEFLLRDGADTKEFAAEYTAKGLPANGPAITKPLIRLMNALSNGLMIMVILLVSIVLLLISMLCIRFTLLTQLESDRREIGMLKTIGISRRDIRQIYFLKFMLLSGAGAVIGLLLAALAERPVSEHLKELYGTSENILPGFAAALAGAVLTEVILLLSIRRTLKGIEKMSAVEALAGYPPKTKRKKQRIYSSQYLIVALVIALGMFMMVLPQNLLSTISSPDFVTYMGIGDGEIRLDIRQTEDIEDSTKQVESLLSEDSQPERMVSLKTISCRAYIDDESGTSLQVEQGDHTVFSLTYAKGKAPTDKNEIALSCLCADDLGLSVGDTLKIAIGENMQESAQENIRGYTVCGIYSDITNGGKTAKAAYLPGDGPVMWSVFYVSLKDGTDREKWLSKLADELSDCGINAKAVDIQEYVTATYGQTIDEIRTAARLAVLAAVLVMMTVVVLFTRLLVAKERYDISLRKAIGFMSRDIKVTYLLRYIPVMLCGIIAGALLGNLPGEKLAGLLLNNLGATGLDFIIDYKIVWVLLPCITIAAVLCSILLGLKEIKNIRAYECCVGKE